MASYINNFFIISAIIILQFTKVQETTVSKNKNKKYKKPRTLVHELERHGKHSEITCTIEQTENRRCAREWLKDLRHARKHMNDTIGLILLA